MHRASMISIFVLSCLCIEAHAGRALVEVSPARATSAREERGRSDELYVAERFEEALAGYERALVYHEHPALYFSVALCQLELGDWARAADNFEAALAFDAGLGRDDRERASDYVKQAATRIATLEVVSTQGAAVAVDGHVVLSRGGRTSIRVMPGAHVVTAKRGETEASERVTLRAGGHARVTPTLRETIARTRWARWKPWAVVTAGSLVALASAPMFARRYSFTERANALALGCVGCGDGDEYDALLADADRHGRRATIALVAGGAVVVTGLVLVALNRTTQERRPVPTVDVAASSVSVGVMTRW